MRQPAPASGYYAASPTSTSSNPGNPRTPDGTVDIELEVKNILGLADSYFDRVVKVPF